MLWLREFRFWRAQWFGTRCFPMRMRRFRTDGTNRQRNFMNDRFSRFWQQVFLGQSPQSSSPEKTLSETTTTSRRGAEKRQSAEKNTQRGASRGVCAAASTCSVFGRVGGGRQLVGDGAEKRWPAAQTGAFERSPGGAPSGSRLG